MKPSRRSVLKALGVFASLPLGRLVTNSMAWGQSAPPPQRFIGVYHPHGIAAECFTRRPGETETSFDLNFADSALTPFDSPALYGGRSFKSRIITFEGVDLAVAELSGTSGHGAAATLFTGSMTTGGDHNAQNESLDQYLARTKGLGSSNRFPTLNLGVGSIGDVNQDSIAHGPGGAMIRNQVDPLKVFDQVFGSMTGSADAGVSAAARARGQSVIDYVRGDLTSLSSRLAAPEQLKLEQHLEAIRDIETRLNSVTALTCTAPVRPLATGNADPSLDFEKTLKYNGGEPYFDRIADLQVDLLALAMVCDATRFATLFFDDPGKVMTVDGTALPADVHDEVAHTYSTANSSTQVRLGRLNRYYFGKIARLMMRLDEGGLLDHTLIMSGSDMGNPSLHSMRNIPLVLAGGAGGQLTMGRRIKAGADCPATTPYCTAPALALTSHNKVLVSIAQLFGDTAQHFGTASDATLTTGPWPGLV